MFDGCRLGRFAALIMAIGLCCGCASRLSGDQTTAELMRLRASLRQNEERMAALQAHQEQLTKQMQLLTIFMGVMANDAAKKAELARKRESMAATPAPATPDDPSRPAQPANDLEF